MILLTSYNYVKTGGRGMENPFILQHYRCAARWMAGRAFWSLAVLVVLLGLGTRALTEPLKT